MMNSSRWVYKRFGLWGLLDSWGHRLHFPGFFQGRICDRFDAGLLK